MPTFRTKTTPGLALGIRNFLRTNRSSALDELQADIAAATTARNMSLAEKARAEVEAMRKAEEARNNPALATEFASHSAGVNLDDGNRLMQHIRGAAEPYHPADADDAAIVGREAPSVRMAAPNLAPGQDRTFRSSLAALIANKLATGKTNADQLAGSVEGLTDASIVSQAADTPSVPDANRLISAVAKRAREPFATNPQGTVIDQETGDLYEGGELAGATRELTGARTATERSRQGELGTRSSRNTAIGRLADARARHLRTGKGATPVAPERITRMIDMSAQAEFKVRAAAHAALPIAQRKNTKAPTFEEIRADVEKRYRNTNAAVTVEDALEAIANGADPEAVRARFRQLTGTELPVDDDEDEGE